MAYHATRREFMVGLGALGLIGPSAAGPAGAPVTVRRGLVIMAEFPDAPLRIGHAFVAERFRSLDHYVREMSYGRTGVDATLSGWHMLPDPLARYAISPINLNVDKARVAKLIQDAIDAADRSNDFSRYDHVVVFLRARFADYGMVGLCGYPGMLGWQSDIGFTTRSGQAVPGGVAIFTASAHTGTLFHDCAHVWGGVRNGKRQVPCLYDHDLQVAHPTRDQGWEEALINMGFWDPMSCHFSKRDLPPPGISCWTKLRLGWLAPEKVKDVPPGLGSAEVLLGPLGDATADTLAVRVPLTPARYLLIENRQPIGDYDRHLPGHGILIMAADDDIAECRHGRAPVRLIAADPTRKYLEGAAFDLPEHPTWEDGGIGVRVTLAEKVGPAYRIRVERLA